MFCKQRVKLLLRCRRERRPAPIGDINVHHHDFDRSRQLLSRVVDEEAHEIGALGRKFHQPDMDRDAFIDENFGEVADMLLQGEITNLVRGRVTFAQADAPEDLAQPAFDKMHVILHVDVLVLIQKGTWNCQIICAIQLANLAQRRMDSGHFVSRLIGSAAIIIWLPAAATSRSGATFPIRNRLRSERILLKLQSIKPGNISSLRCLGSAPFGWLSQLRWSPRGDMLAICGGDGIAVYVNEFGGSPTFRLREHAAPVKDMAFSPDGKLLASCSADTMIMLYTLEQGNAHVATAIRDGRNSVEAIAFSPDGEVLASGGADHTIRLWTVATGEQTAALDGHTDEVTALRFANNGNCLFSAGRDGLIRCWDLNTGARSDAVGRHDDWIRQIALRPGRAELASASRDMTIGLWSLDSRKESRTWSAHAGGADALAFSPDGRLLASGGRDSAIRIWDVDAAREAMALKAHRRPVLALEFNPAGALLASGAGDNKVMLWAVG